MAVDPANTWWQMMDKYVVQAKNKTYFLQAGRVRELDDTIKQIRYNFLLPYLALEVLVGLKLILNFYA